MASRIMLRDRKPFAQWLRRKLKDERMTQHEFEKALGLAHGMVSHWVNANRSPSPRSIQKIARFFGEDQYYLLTLAGYSAPTEDVSDEADPRVRIIAKVRDIDWTDERVRYVEYLLDDFRSAGKGPAPSRHLKWRTTPGRVLVSSPN